MASSVSKLIPSDPDKVMIIRRITPNLMTCSVPFYRFSRIRIGGRATIVKLKDESLAVFSPVALTNNVKSQMQEQLGSTDVKYLAALDQEHHIFLEQWHKEYPQAKIIAPETLPELRTKQGYPNFPDNWRLVTASEGTAQSTIKIDPTFDAEFDIEYVPSHVNKELVFCHKPTKTLIEADLMFNLPATEQHSKVGDAHTGILTKLFIALNRTTGANPWQKRLIWYGTSSGDRKGFGESMRKIDKFDFDRIVPCHGDVIESGGKGVFEKIMVWFLESGKKSN
jgi:hypothetical protein